MTNPSVRILLVEDDEDDYCLVRSMLSKVPSPGFHLYWVNTYDGAVEATTNCDYDICLLDYHLGEGRNGLDLFQELTSRGLKAPIIFLTGQKDYQLDVEAMKAGAADFLVKDQISTPLLERSIRYAIERRRSEDALRESEERLRFIMETSGDAIYRLKYDTMTYEYLSPVIERLTGYTPEEVNSIGFARLICKINQPGEENVSAGLLAKKRREGRTREYFADYLIRTKSGSLRWLGDHSLPWYNDHGQLVGSVGILSDITERKQVEQALRKSEQKFRMLVETMNEGLGVQDEKGAITYVNDKMCEILGYRREELLGLPAARLIDKSKRSKVLRMNSSRDLCNRSCYEVNLIAKGGRRIPTILSSSPIVNGEGEFKGIISTITDITLRKSAEKTLLESREQLRFLSSQLLKVQERERQRIANEIHDSVGQSLHTIKIGVRDIAHKLETGEQLPDPEVLQDILRITEFAIEEVRNIYMDLRPSLLDDLGLLATISWFLRECEKTYPHVRVQREITVSEDEIPTYLKTVIFRVLQGAMENVGRHSRADTVKVILRISDEEIDFTIEDNGRGFDLGSGMSLEGCSKGLGIACMQERVESSSGVFTIRSLKGVGTTVRACWPCLLLGEMPAEEQAEEM